ncbi:MAG TPA: hypothetical protein VFV29_03685 [Actinomycetota bacterium]|nr:hypothetical protein [Actinomycetota bacterium]
MIGARTATLGVLAVVVLAACASHAPAAGMESMMPPTTNGIPTDAPNAIVLRGTFVKLTGFPCHRSDPYVGGETVTFRGSDGSRTTIVTGSANWVGLSATPEAPLGQCRQVAPFTADLPPAGRYVVVINDRRLPAVTLAELRADGLTHTFRLPS